MDRAFKSGAAAAPPAAPAAPSIGYPTQGDASAGVPPTKPGAWWYHMITEELRAIVVAGGLTPSQSDTSQVLQALQAIFPSAPAGDVRMFARGVLPTGRWLKANGAAVPVSSYSDLAVAIYCGDANNATADWGYRTTSSTSPSANRSTTGVYIVLPDYRGRFPRGWADDGSIDSARNKWKYQDHAQQDHYHSSYGVNNANGSGVGSGVLGAAWGTNTGGVLNANVATENRPVNAAVLFGIAY